MTIIIDGIPGIRALANKPLGKSDWLEITQDMVNRFADVTQDHNWIHIDPEKAASSPFKGTIAHGFLTMSLLVPLKKSVMELRNVGMGLNYGFEKTRLPSAVPVGSKIRCDITMGDVLDVGDGVQYTLHCVVECDRSEKPALVTDWVLRNYPSAQSRVK